jgi:hypothetical protein
MPFETNISEIPPAAASNMDLPAQEFPTIPRIVTTDLVGPLAANKQEKALERRDLTLRDRVNRLINNNNLLDARYVQISDLEAQIIALITEYGIRRDGTSDACTAQILLSSGGLITDPAAAARLDMVIQSLLPGYQTMIGKLRSAVTTGGDPDDTLTTKAWVESLVTGADASPPNRLINITTSMTWPVPPGVRKVWAHIRGGRGGHGGGNAGWAVGPAPTSETNRGGWYGPGAEVVGSFPVSPGGEIVIVIGLQGSSAGTAGGYDHAGGGEGGGGTRLRLASTPGGPTIHTVVAGGGSGGGGHAGNSSDGGWGSVGGTDNGILEGGGARPPRATGYQEVGHDGITGALYDPESIINLQDYFPFQVLPDPLAQGGAGIVQLRWYES